MRAFCLFCLLTLMAACADLPSVEGTISAQGQATAYPELVPLAPLLAATPPASPPAVLIRSPRARGPAAVPSDLNTRAARLRARAEALRSAPL